MKKIALVLLGGLILVGAAQAARPYIETQSDNPFTFGSCGFPVLVQPAPHDLTHVIAFSNGDVLATGPFLATATNLDSGRSVDINISGSFSYTAHSDGSFTLTFRGPTLLLTPHVIVDGYIVFEFDAAGNLISRTTVGSQHDICSELAGP